LGSTDVIDIGQKPARSLGLVTFGTGVIGACFHCDGTMEVDNDRLKVVTPVCKIEEAPNSNKYSAVAEMGDRLAQ